MSEPMKLFELALDFKLFVEVYLPPVLIALLTVFLEWRCWDAKWHAKFTKDPYIRKLYMEAVVYSGFLYFLSGPVVSVFIFGMVFGLFGSTEFPSVIAIPGLLFVQAVGYALLHKWMHNPKNYWIHKFHHRYNELTFVRPVTANAVTITESTLAYLVPVMVGILLFRPCRYATLFCIHFLGVFNILVHTPTSVIDMKAYLPTWMVTNEAHFEHHEKDVTLHYSSPLLKLDRFLGIENIKKAK